MSIRLVRAGLSGLAVALVPISESVAHEIVGNRFFPATLAIDDPGVNDELSLPTVDSFNTGDNPPVRQRDISAGVFQTDHRGFRDIVWLDLHLPRGSMDPTVPGANGFQNFETTFKYRGLQEPRP